MCVNIHLCRYGSAVTEKVVILTPQPTRLMGKWGEDREKSDMSFWTSLMEDPLLLLLNWRRCMRFPRPLLSQPLGPLPTIPLKVVLSGIVGSVAASTEGS